jgi:hypothetical protein
VVDFAKLRPFYEASAFFRQGSFRQTAQFPDTQKPSAKKAELSPEQK